MTGSSNGYSSIPPIKEGESVEVDPEDDDNGHAWGRLVQLVVSLIALIAIGLSIGILIYMCSDNYVKPVHYKNNDTNEDKLPLPTGINLASWLSLEDYFFVGHDGAVEVATFEGSTVAKCLPPLHVGSSTGPMWNTETDLFASLMSKNNTNNKDGSVAKTIQIFHAFRESYLDFNVELKQIADLGIHHVRVPMSWCLTDFDPSNDEILKDEQTRDNEAESSILLERYACKDPFFEKHHGETLYWPAVPKPLLQDFLRACARYGIKATLDVHTYPGGTSLGTFNGIFPKSPLFWLYDNPEDPEQDVGRTIFRDLLSWIESLIHSDNEAFQGIGAITPMNEPGHLAGLFGSGGPWPEENNFLPPLPEDVAEAYLAKLNQNVKDSRHFKAVPNGNHLRSLLWQDQAVAAFRQSKLPQHGIDIFVNVHESILVQPLVPDDPNDPGGRHPEGTTIFLAWWRGITTAEERATWAVLDMHHYHAWDGQCMGAVDGSPSGSYTCGNLDAMNDVLAHCTSWATMYRKIADQQLGSSKRPARLVSGEFSASTHHSVRHSCLDETTLHASYTQQVEKADAAGVELYWWGWKMPYGGAFRRAWSFKHFLYLMGVDGFDKPDETDLPCGV
ncbi:MAG: hypothetical protein SGBAC_010905 [Bacillariaceae sp.]